MAVKESKKLSTTAFLSKEAILKDFEICCISREASFLARREVLTGKAKFGILGDGKEVPQVAMARAFQAGDFRSGYYRDQTFLFALGLTTVEHFFAQLYADPENDPFSGGRQMNNHPATPLINQQGEWANHKALKNISADIAPTAGQMARALGLALASKKYRKTSTLQEENSFSHQGNEVCFCTIGDASTSEGIFWETVNAAGVMQVPLAISVWDDGYGISVPIKHQTTKESISTVLSGFEKNQDSNGIKIYKEKGWDYPALVKLYRTAIEEIRNTHTPALLHIQELTQPQGHSTSGSHERYKTKERLQWEREHDCILKMEQWIIESGFANEEELYTIRKKAKQTVREGRDRAWKAFSQPIKAKQQELKMIVANLPQDLAGIQEIQQAIQDMINPLISELLQYARRIKYLLVTEDLGVPEKLNSWINQIQQTGTNLYNSNLYSNSSKSALKVQVIPATYDYQPEEKNGFQILNAFFDHALEKYGNLFAFGEDVGQIGDVNQGFSGLQAKYGKERVFDTGIREWTIMGQAIGMAMRGLRPIAEIQYLDYLIYGISPLSDDLATLRYRSNGQQQAPAIIRTRGHRLEGIWHAGSPLGMLINAVRGIYVLVPRNMTQAVGFYNTMLQSDDPAIIIECLNGYRLKEPLPNNVGEYTLPLGTPEVLIEGNDITLVTYGSCVRIAMESIRILTKMGISVELIDVQTLIPFDLEHRILNSIKKTNRVLFLDEDVPGGATAYMMQQVLVHQKAYQYLDSQPVTLSAKAHRPAYGSDGDYFSKPNSEDVVELIYFMMQESNPSYFPKQI